MKTNRLDTSCERVNDFFQEIICVYTRALHADNGRESVQWNRGNGTVGGSGLKGITYRIYNSPKHSLKHTHFSSKHIHNPTKCHTFATPAPSLSTMPKSGVVLFLFKPKAEHSHKIQI